MGLSIRSELIEQEMQDIQMRVKTALGKAPADLVLKECKVVSVYSGEIIEADIVIKGNKIASIANDFKGESSEVLNCKGLYAAPGFIEPHMHIETSYAVPSELARILVPRGTTTVIADFTDHAYVSGIEASKAMLENLKGLPLRCFVEAPSYGPAQPEIQTSGEVIGLQETLAYLEWPETKSLGEVLPQKVYRLDEDYLRTIAAYRIMGKRIDAHGEGIYSDDVYDPFVTAGATDNHGAHNFNDVLQSLRRGMVPFVVDTPGRRFLEPILRGVIKHNLDTSHLCFCVDNISILDIVREGYDYLDRLVRQAIEIGLPAVKAYQMATINVASYYGLDHVLGSITPGRYADILLLKDLDHYPPVYVLAGGKIVAKDGQPTWERDQREYAEWTLETVKFHSSIKPERLVIKAPHSAKSVKIRGIKLATDPSAQTLIAMLNVVDGIVKPDFENDILPFLCIERYGKNGNIGYSFIKGTNLKRGAFAMTLSLSDSNCVAVGCDPVSIMTCLEALEINGGGIAVAEGKDLIAKVDLGFLGEMSTLPYEETIAQLEKAIASVNELGCSLDNNNDRNPFSLISAIVIPTVPELGLSDFGLIDARTGQLTDTIIEWIY